MPIEILCALQTLTVLQWSRAADFRLKCCRTEVCTLEKWDCNLVDFTVVELKVVVYYDTGFYIECGFNIIFQSHSDVLDHGVIDIHIYSRQSKKIETRLCSQHSTQAITMACTTCSKTLCAYCFDGEAKCDKGMSMAALQSAR